MKIDNKDKAILYQLESDARTPVSQIAKQVRMSKQVADYRLKQLVSRGVIRGFRVVVDIHRLGYFTYRVYLRLQNVKPEGEKALFEKLAALNNCITVLPLSGRWDAEVVLAARNTVHFASLLLELRQAMGGHLKEYAISPSVVNYHFKRRYLSANPERENVVPHYGFEPPKEEIAQMDFQILKLLSEDASFSLTDMGARVGLGYNAVKQRMTGLEKRGVIQTYRTWLDLEKVGRHYYKALITLSAFDEKIEKRLLAFCENQPSITYLVECAGNWDLELDGEVESEPEFRKILMEFRGRFEDIVKDYEVLTVYPEKKMDYFPFGRYVDLEPKRQKIR